MNHRYLWYGALLACAGDVTTTFIGVEALGIAEKNPLIVELMASIGVLPALLVSKVGVLAVAATFYQLHRHHISGDHEWLMPLIPIMLYVPVTALNVVAIASAL